MCIFQRLVCFILGAILGLAFAAWRIPALRFSALVGALVVNVWAIVVSAKQSWLQWFPESGFSCTLPEPGYTERLIDCLGQWCPTLFMATGFCGSKDLVILGLSLANWSFLFFVVTLLAILAILRGCEFHFPSDDNETRKS